MLAGGIDPLALQLDPKPFDLCLLVGQLMLLLGQLLLALHHIGLLGADLALGTRHDLLCLGPGIGEKLLGFVPRLSGSCTVLLQGLPLLSHITTLLLQLLL